MTWGTTSSRNSLQSLNRRLLVRSHVFSQLEVNCSRACQGHRCWLCAFVAESDCCLVSSLAASRFRRNAPCACTYIVPSMLVHAKRGHSPFKYLAMTHIFCRRRGRRGQFASTAPKACIKCSTFPADADGVGHSSSWSADLRASDAAVLFRYRSHDAIRKSSLGSRGIQPGCLEEPTFSDGSLLPDCCRLRSVFRVASLCK
jgi:hypothetical protein